MFFTPRIMVLLGNKIVLVWHTAEGKNTFWRCKCDTIDLLKAIVNPTRKCCHQRPVVKLVPCFKFDRKGNEAVRN